MEDIPDVSNAPSFSELLKGLRIRSGLTQRELADRARLSARTISDLERGRRTKAYESTVKMLSDAMALQPEETIRLAESVNRSRKQRSRPPASAHPQQLSLMGQRDLLTPLLASVAEAVIGTDLEGNVVFWNAAASDLYGYSADEAIGTTIYDLTVPDIAESLARDIMRSLNSGLAWSGQFNVKDRSGRTFLVKVTDVPVVDSSGDLALIIGFSRAEGTLSPPGQQP